MGRLNQARSNSHEHQVPMQSLQLRPDLRLPGNRVPVHADLPVRLVLQVRERLRKVSR